MHIIYVGVIKQTNVKACPGQAGGGKVIMLSLTLRARFSKIQANQAVLDTKGDQIYCN